MSRSKRIFLSLVAIVLLGQGTAMAFPDYLDLYKSDPFRRADVGGCNVCHMSATGGGEHNSFGFAFFDAGERITPMLRANYPDRFDYTQSIVGDMIVHFSDPDDSRVVIEVDDIKYLIDLVSRDVTKGAMKMEPNPSAIVGSNVSLNTKHLIPVGDFTNDGAFFGPRIVNMPNAKPIDRGAVEFLIGHRFTMPIFKKESVANLFGFDSAAFVSTHSFGNRFSLAISPGIAFNTRDESTLLPAHLLFGNDSDYTASLGLGAGLRLTKTFSVVGN